MAFPVFRCPASLSRPSRSPRSPCRSGSRTSRLLGRVVQLLLRLRPLSLRRVLQALRAVALVRLLPTLALRLPVHRLHRLRSLRSSLLLPKAIVDLDLRLLPTQDLQLQRTQEATHQPLTVALDPPRAHLPVALARVRVQVATAATTLTLHLSAARGGRPALSRRLDVVWRSTVVAVPSLIMILRTETTHYIHHTLRPSIFLHFFRLSVLPRYSRLLLTENACLLKHLNLTTTGS